MDLDELQRHWNEWGRRDPFFAIISRPDRRENTWELGEFLATGVEEIATLFAWLDELQVEYPTTRALDFGCGVGRLTQAMAGTFSECDGVDIAPSMIALANEINEFGERCRYHVNDRDDLALFDDAVFDLIYSDIVLQHIEPEFSAHYLKEFTRVLAAGGVLVFQLPSHPLGAGDDAPDLPSIADEAFRAEIDLVDPDPGLVIEAGSILKQVVRVRNASAAPWPADRYVNLGNHWRDANGAMLRQDDGRASLTGGAEPGAKVDLTLEMQTPAEAGSYLVEFDLVIEGVAWFADRGSPTTTVPVEVVPRTVAATADDAIIPVMEMHGVPRAEVEALLRDGGLDIVTVKETDKAAGWNDFWYVARKPALTPGTRRRARDFRRRR